ncbi:F-box domain-containing protein [Favolaschia claudopus]|uniref:F-box domain-containing protein n=1 Tax=Favolaschia claudopus TaxID=2862362 RepID=A0AAW0DJ44_9AGAR
MLQYMEADRALLAETDTEIVEFKAQMSLLRQKIAGSEDTRKLVQGRLQSYKYPVLSLPNEIVSEIFLHFIPPYPHPAHPVAEDSPAVLARVCRKWREIALATPSLWRAITMSSAISKSALLWAERSRSCLLSIDGCGSGPFIMLPRDRWEYLKLRLGRDGPDISAISFPHLRSLQLTAQQSQQSRHSFTLRDVPLLRSVSLDYANSATIDLPWAQLNVFHMSNTRLSKCMPILRNSPRLERCVLHFWVQGPSDNPDSDILLPQLQSLYLRPFSTSLEALLRNLVAPALLRLALAENLIPADSVIDTIQSFISKSECKLQELNISYATISEASYRIAFPSIDKISVYPGKAPDFSSLEAF